MVNPEKKEKINSINKVVSKKAKQAIALHEKGFMCSESILMSYAEEFGINPEIAASISGGFAGGMAQGKTCGAVTGAIMVIGLKYGARLKRDQYSKDLCFQITQEFSHRFIERQKTLECSEILIRNNINPKNPEEMRSLRDKKICYKIVIDSAEILEEILSEELYV